MHCEYAIRTLKNRKVELQNVLDEIENGNYENHLETNIKRFKTMTYHNLKEIELGLEILEGYED